MQPESRIKVAVQKSGRLADNSLELLRRCGLKYSRGRDRLICFGENMPVDVLLVRDDDIPTLLAEGTCELGIVGRNLLLEAGGGEIAPGLQTICDLDFGHCRLAIAVPRGVTYDGPASIAGQRVATTYPRVLERWLESHGVSAEIVKLSGAVEIAPQLGRADLICDLVSTGTTLAANDLVEVETVLESSAMLVRRNPVADDHAEWIERLEARARGVVEVRGSKYIMLHAPRPSLPTIRDLLPGVETPTVIPLEGPDDRVAVHAVCREAVFWETLESLKQAGATSVLVLPVEKMLA